MASTTAPSCGLSRSVGSAIQCNKYLPTICCSLWLQPKHTHERSCSRWRHCAAISLALSSKNGSLTMLSALQSCICS
jgi:hypothetical protein